MCCLIYSEHACAKWPEISPLTNLHILYNYERSVNLRKSIFGVYFGSMVITCWSNVGLTLWCLFSTFTNGHLLVLAKFSIIHSICFFFSRLERSVLKSWFLTEILVSSVQWNNSEKKPELLNVTLPGVQCIYDIWAVLWFISECDTLWANMTRQSSLNVNWKLFADIVCATRYSCKKKKHVLRNK